MAEKQDVKCDVCGDKLGEAETPQEAAVLYDAHEKKCTG